MLAAGDFVDALDKPGGNGVVERYAVETGLHGVRAARVFAELGEDGGGRTVDGIGGDGLQLAAPGCAGAGHVVDLALVFVEVEFVEEHIAALASEDFGRGGKGHDAGPRWKLDNERPDVVLRVEDLDVVACETAGDDVA